MNRFRLDARRPAALRGQPIICRSNDYYSSRNYASRLIGNRLIFYTPLYLDWDDDPLEALPGIRKWQPGYDEDTPFRPDRHARARSTSRRGCATPGRYELDTLHSVTDCDLTAPVLNCSAVGVLGAASRTFYVSSGAVYLWVSDFRTRRRRSEPRPSSTACPSAASGLRRSRARRAGRSILVPRGPARRHAQRPAARRRRRRLRWAGRRSAAAGVALLRLPIAEFGDGSDAAAPRRAIGRCPDPKATSWNRSTTASSAITSSMAAATMAASRPADRRSPRRCAAAASPACRFAMRSAGSRCSAATALVVGSGRDESLGFTAVELGRRRPARRRLHPARPRQEGETRSHAFFFRPDNADGSSGHLGLPIAKPVEPAYRRFFGSAAAMLFLRRDDRRFAEAGELAALVRGVADDDCKASCTDWYGNARPIFLRRADLRFARLRAGRGAPRPRPDRRGPPHQFRARRPPPLGAGSLPREPSFQRKLESHTYSSFQRTLESHFFLSAAA